MSVAALSAVGFFTDRIRNGMQRDARQSLAADLLVTSDAPLDRALRADAAARSLRTAATTSMVSMAMAGQGDEARSQLVSLKGVSDGYPLRGALTFAPDSGPAAAPAVPPAPGTAWIDPALASRLDVRPGGKLRVGDAEFLITRLIAVEPDRRFSPVNLSPRVMQAERDLPATGLLAPGVRATHGLLFAAAAWLALKALGRLRGLFRTPAWRFAVTAGPAPPSRKPPRWPSA